MQESETPLITAARNGHTDMVRYLISKKANIDLKDKVSKCFAQFMAVCMNLHIHIDGVHRSSPCSYAQPSSCV